jgi:membrane-associated phospholipid phosphatase
MPGNRALWRSWIYALVASAVFVPVCIAYVDRPLALYFSREITESGIRGLLVWLVLPFGPILSIAIIVVVAAGLRSLSGREFPSRLRPLIVPTVAMAIGTGVEFILKVVTARGEIWPTYIHDKQYGFDFLHYRDGWRSFPSGTAIGLFALVGVLLVHRSRWSSTALCISIVLCATLTIVTYHWLSDVIAGMFLGLTIGYAVASLFPPAAPRV